VMVPKLASRLAFLSDSTYVPSGLSAADALCQREAAAAQLPGTYQALLASSSTSASARFDLTRPTWARVDAIPWLEKATDLATGKVLSTLTVGPTGAYSVYARVWTGATDPSAPSVTSAQNCADWTSTTQVGISGYAQFSTLLFFNNVTQQACNDSNTHIY